jgi:hypothetical protein
LQHPILAACQPCGFVFPTSRYSGAKTHQRASLSHKRGGGRLFGSGTGLGIAVSKMAT